MIKGIKCKKIKRSGLSNNTKRDSSMQKQLELHKNKCRKQKFIKNHLLKSKYSRNMTFLILTYSKKPIKNKTPEKIKKEP